MTDRPYLASAWSYLIGDTVYAGPDLTYFGIGSAIESGPVQTFQFGDHISAGKHLREALESFRPDIPRPFDDSTKRLPQPVLKAAKIKSFKALMAVAKTVSITEWPNGRIDFLPCKNAGPRMGYAPIFPAETTTTDGDIGAALFRAYERCE